MEFNKTKMVKKMKDSSCNPSRTGNAAVKGLFQHNAGHALLTETSDKRAKSTHVSRSYRTGYFLRELKKPLQIEEQKSCLQANKKRFNIYDPLTSRPYFYHLPCEIISMIFSYMSTKELVTNIMLVCKRWNQIAKGPLFWRHLEFTDNHVSKVDAIRLLKMSPLLKRIVIQNRNDFEELLNVVCQSNQEVESLSLKMCQTPDINHRSDLRKCCDTLPYCIFPNQVAEWMQDGGGVIRSVCINNLLKYCTKIKHLDLINLTIRSRKYFGGIGLHWMQLTNLCIVNCFCFSAQNLSTIADNCHNLSHLIILKTYISNVVNEITWDEAYSHVLHERGNTLRLLELDIGLISDSTLKDLTKCTRLQTLSLENAINLSNQGLFAISHLQYLDHLHLQNAICLNQNTINSLFKPGKLGMLKTLTLPKCYYLNNLCLETIGASCFRLEKLDISFCSLVTDLGIEYIFKKCLNLNYIDLFKTRQVTGLSFRLIPEHTPNLRILIIELYTGSIKDVHTNTLLTRFPKIKISRY